MFRKLKIWVTCLFHPEVNHEKICAISKNLGECLEIMDWPVSDKDTNWWILINPSDQSSRNKNEYLKLIDRKNKKIARLSLREPKYIAHYGHDGHKSWILTDIEKEMLMILLLKPSERNSDYTNWQAIINSYNNELDSEQSEFFLPTDLPIPDYTQLKP